VKKTPDLCPPEVKRPRDTVDRIADAMHALRADKPAPEAILRLRAKLANELVDLVPLAIANAKRGKPALLRLLLRFK